MRLAWAALLLLAGCAAGPRDFSDATEARFRAGDYPAASSHAEALARWRRAEDLNAFIGERFEYDRQRAMRLSETQRAQGPRVPILAPAAFFAEPRGVCVDLTRFAVETLNAIEPGAAARFIMIEFEPLTIGGNTLRLHWLASFRRDGRYYFFADSKRPGHMAGPYDTVEAFIADYEGYRGRKVVRHLELESFERKTRARVVRQERFSTTQ
jgi:hypothetical protein